MPDTPPLLKLTAENFLSLKKVTLTLGPVNVLVGPNNAGKSNLLEVFALLGELARDDLEETLDRRGGYKRLKFYGETTGPIRLGIEAAVTTHSSDVARDVYTLTLSQGRLRNRIDGSSRMAIRRTETFKFKRFRGPGRRINVSGGSVHLTGDVQQKLDLRSDSLALATLPRMAPNQGGTEIGQIAELFSTFRVFDVDVDQARRPQVVSESDHLRSNGANVAPFLEWLREKHGDIYSDLLDDARAIVPGLINLEFDKVAGSEIATIVGVVERGLRKPTPLAYVSYGTIRTLAILALLHDPNPPLLTCIEELDRGLHPYVFDRLVDRMRIASVRTQFLIATHSPALVNRLRWNELIVCERSEDGSSLIPAISQQKIREILDATDGDLRLGEIWFSGSLGGVP